MQPHSAPEIPTPPQAELEASALCCSCSCTCTSGLHIETEPDQPEPICKTCAADPDVYGRCRLCPADRVHLVGELDAKALCAVHSGEMDFSDSELSEIESLAQYLQNQ